MSAEEFFGAITGAIGDAFVEGREFIAKFRQDTGGRAFKIPLVSDLMINLNKKTEFLLGEIPQWSDIHENRAIIRKVDSEILKACNDHLARKGMKGVLIITGTAGSGKTTSMMRLAYGLNNQGKKVGWLDNENEYSSRNLKEFIRGNKIFDVICIDEADALRNELTSCISEICKSDSSPLVVMTVRSGRIDKYINPEQLRGIPNSEITIRYLEDSDIEDLIKVLKRENRLGILKNEDIDTQKKAFRDQAGRLLIVGMIQATSGEDFKKKLVNELGGLDALQKRVYSLLVVTTYLGFGLTKENILTGISDSDGGVLKAIDGLHKRHLLSITGSDRPNYRVLHQIIAEVIFDRMANTPEMYANIASIGVISAATISPNMDTKSKPKQLLRRSTSHEFLIKNLGIDEARNVYGFLEQFPIICDDEHYWLQRGSIEVEIGSISLAENFLDQASKLRPTSVLIKNEIAYLNFKKALSNPSNSTSFDLVEDATRELQRSIDLRPLDPYPYGILGKQGLEWVRWGLTNTEQKKEYLQRLLKVLEKGCREFPKNNEINNTYTDLKREYLGLAVS